jgi:hypothetical protein
MGKQVPVLLVIFNRPQETRLVVEALRNVKPARLFVAADGPRSDHHEDEEKCRIARKVATEIDWPCDLKTRFLDDNVGCGRGVSSAIDWFFQHVEHGVILEDDCVPHPDFFPFCAELFKRYEDDERIMRISGFAPYPVRRHPYDYHFSRRFRCWGWGAWRRAWKYFSYDLSAIDPNEFQEMLKSYYPFHFRRRPWKLNFKRTISGDLKTWAFRWDVACFVQNGLTIVPEKNLIRNVGFGENATHTRNKATLFADIRVHSLQFPLRHPPHVYADGRPEQCLEKAIHAGFSLRGRCTQRLRHVWSAMIDFYNTMP